MARGRAGRRFPSHAIALHPLGASVAPLPRSPPPPLRSRISILAAREEEGEEEKESLFKADAMNEERDRARRWRKGGVIQS